VTAMDGASFSKDKANMVSRARDGRGPSLRRGAAAAAVLALLVSAGASAVAAVVMQRDYASPEQAVTALAAAARDGKPAELVRILGAAGNKLVYSGDPVADKQGRERFVAAYDEAHKITRDGDAKAELAVGKDAWPFPIPLVRHGGTWHFDTRAGAREILDRRIGGNELSAIEVCRAYVDAQEEYASKGLSDSKVSEYAQKFTSSPGKHDGLYWPVQGSEPESPMGPLVAQARAEGYGPRAKGEKPRPYHGYYYRILTRQGKDASGGAYDYIVSGHMIGGFALVAFPAKYRDSGVMTFIVNHDGVVYQKNLGPDSAEIARHMTAFDPDSSWTPVK